MGWVSYPGHISVGPDQHGRRGGDRPERRKLPRTVVGGVEQLNSIRPGSDVEAAGLTEVEEDRPGLFFPPGPGGAHAVRNDSDATARVLMFSDVSKVAASVYPDSDKIAIWTGNPDDDVIVKRTSGVDYWDGET